MKGFNSDNFILEEVKKLIKDFNIDQIIETGTYHGDTTKELARLVPLVHTIEVNPAYQAVAQSHCKGISNIYWYLGSSPEVLNNQLLPNNSKNLLIFLDAHWGSYNPLLDELRAIAKHGLKPVILIHDFKVPGKDFGFDSYGGQDYDWAWVKDDVEKIFGKDYRMYYNEKAEGSKRGIVYIVPMKLSLELGEGSIDIKTDVIKEPVKKNESGSKKVAGKSGKKL